MAVLAGLVIAIVSVTLFRLWSLQVLSGDHYRALADDNRIREVRVQPPRGQILDRHGRVLVDNRTTLRLELRLSELPDSPAERRRQLARLARVAEISPSEMRRRIRETPQFTGYPVVLRQGIDRRLL